MAILQAALPDILNRQEPEVISETEGRGSFVLSITSSMRGEATLGKDRPAKLSLLPLSYSIANEYSFASRSRNRSLTSLLASPDT